jgi:hypothetical protein
MMVASRSVPTLIGMVYVTEMRCVRGERARAWRQRSSARAEPEVRSVGTRKRHEPRRDQRAQQQRRQEQPRQALASGSQLRKCPAHALIVVPRRGSDIGVRTPGLPGLW